ncbi:PHP domain-containing protein [Paenibacillus beijingensis]|uniref:Polymerase/histidinol phosphatase N-terminal domain-containing protein n=1 Tax=Paenibacillus beijingensis TaxID=1126833 RepID=A0A0D5NEZ1_9BACL|nr:PHP domain-containing protein [Paenibacillus beijingensis]AJY73488.1 hypothetical protein VN24_01175 [Paenibacillus beijingensis]
MKIQRMIGKHEEQTYLEVPFEVNGEIERIEVRYRYDNPDGRAVIDIGLRSPERIAGWSGGARDEFFVALEKATPGYLAGPITEGTWYVLLGAYRVPDDGCTVTIEIELTTKHGRWMKGDLHMHSLHSDGSYTIAEVIEICKERGLSFIALTDHNTASQNKTAANSDDQLLLIPGVELTSYKGHANILGHPDALDDFRVLTPDHGSNVLQKAAGRGGLVSLNHPFCPDCPWELGFDVSFDAVEVWNGPWRPLNEAAVGWWHKQLCEGRRLPAIGGSDTHRPDLFVRHGRPTTHVWVEAETVDDVLTAVRTGRVVLSCDPDDTFITLASGSSRIGDEIEMDGLEHIELTLEVHRANNDRVSLWSDCGLEQEWIVDGNAELTCAAAADRLFYRVEARRYIPEMDKTIMTCLTNPIYLRGSGKAGEGQ